MHKILPACFCFVAYNIEKTKFGMEIVYKFHLKYTN